MLLECAEPSDVCSFNNETAEKHNKMPFSAKQQQKKKILVVNQVDIQPQTWKNSDAQNDHSWPKPSTELNGKHSHKTGSDIMPREWN